MEVGELNIQVAPIPLLSRLPPATSTDVSRDNATDVPIEEVFPELPIIGPSIRVQFESVLE